MFALLLTILLSSPAQERKAEIDFEALATWVEDARAAYRAPGLSLAIVGPEGARFLRGFGIRDLARQPVTADTLFAIGSHTKTFTTALFALLAEEHGVGWDDPVQEILPTFRLADEGASTFCTLRDLACHRTGVGRLTNLWMSGTRSREEIVAALATAKASAEFQERWLYNNVQFVALGLATEKLGGASWEELVRKRFFEPLGMTRARFVINDKELEDVSRGFGMENGELVEVPRRDLGPIGPAGSIEASARDVARWIAFHLNHGEHGGKQIVPAARLAELYEEQIEIDFEGVNAMYRQAYPTADRVGYGLGWFVLTCRGRTVLEHGGGIDGFSSVVGFVPDLEVGYVLLQNAESGDSVLPMAVREHLLDLLTGTERGDWMDPGSFGIRGQLSMLEEDPAR